MQLSLSLRSMCIKKGESTAGEDSSVSLTRHYPSYFGSGVDANPDHRIGAQIIAQIIA